jgi:hypothetical protein
MIYAEYNEQIKVIKWFKQMQGYNVINNDYILSANRATHKLTKIQAGRAKAEGMVKGIPDLILYAKMQEYGGLFIEMKAPNLKPKRVTSKGGLSDAQIDILLKLNNSGYKVVICYTSDEAIKEIGQYLNLKI